MFRGGPYPGDMRETATLPTAADVASSQSANPGTFRPLPNVVAAHRAARSDRARRLTTSASIGLVALGIALVGVGLLGDSKGWWQSRPFLTNVLSTIGGACFGLPVALVVLRRVAETRDGEAAAQRDAAESAMLCERMKASALRIERYWADVRLNTADHAVEDDDWGALVADVTRLANTLRTTEHGTSPEIAAAVHPLTVRFRTVGMGGVHVAVREILQDWVRLQNLAGPLTYLREWEGEWAGTRIIDVRTFGDVLETFDQRSSHVWCDFFARLPDSGALEERMLPDLRANAQLALRFLYDTATIITRIRGAHALPPFWQTATTAYNKSLAGQYDAEQSRNARVSSVEKHS